MGLLDPIFPARATPDDDLALLSDEALLARSIESPRIFEVLLDRYQDAFLRRAESVLHSREDAEDVVQETFTKIYFNASRYRPVEGATFRSWAYRILMNTIFTRYEKVKRRGEGECTIDPEVYESFGDPADRAHEEVMRDYVASFLARMPSSLARPLSLHFIEEYSQKEIAVMEGTSVSAVKTKIYRAKREFRRIMNLDDPTL
jgi:RNA polymerase sigma-70 factor (ECF subfamily)